MNEKDKRAFEAALVERCKTIITVPQDFSAGWQAALEYARGKQEPVAWRGPNWSHSSDQYSYRDYDDPFLGTKGNIVGEPLYTHPAPAVAINEQMLEALKVALRIFGSKCVDAASLDWSIQAATAIRAAEAAKGGA